MKFLLVFMLIPVTIFSQIDHWESLVLAENTCSYFIGNNTPPADWFLPDYNDAPWRTGQGGVGYGDGDDRTTIEPANSVFLRYSFDIVDINSIESAILHGDYDDGFIAYLNGEELFRNNINDNQANNAASASFAHEANLYQGQLPEAFSLSDSQIGLLQEGKNVLALQVNNFFNGTMSSDLSSNFYLSAGITSSNYNYQDIPTWFIPPIGSFSSVLPIIKITTQEYILDEPKVEGQLSILQNSNGEENTSDSNDYSLQTNIAIERRGQSSLGIFPKNGFGFELKDNFGEDTDLSLLGLPEEEDWILHGPYSDKTLMRNVIAMDIARATGNYHSRTRFIELIINDEYQGIYVLMEKIKRDDNRIDISKLTELDNSGDKLTGGYVFKIDKGEFHWSSKHWKQDREEYTRFQMVSPKIDKTTAGQLEYIESFVDSFELALKANNFFYGGKRYDEYIDLESFADHFLVKELAKDVDAYRISSYYYKTKDSKGGKIHAGPVWDFNIAFGNADYCDGGVTSGWMYEFNCHDGIPFWWSRMMSDPVFRNVLQCRMNELSETALNQQIIFDKIDDYRDLLTDAAERNFIRWPVLDTWIWPNTQVRGTFISEVLALKNFIFARLQWMKNQLNKDCEISSVSEQSPLSVDIYPNPFEDYITIEFRDIIEEEIICSVYSSIGKRISQQYASQNIDKKIKIALNGLNSGVYFLRLSASSGEQTYKLIK